MDDYFKPENTEYIKLVSWEYLEGGLVKGILKLGEVEVIGGLGKLEEGLGRLQAGSQGDEISRFSQIWSKSLVIMFYEFINKVLGTQLKVCGI
jgi:hypothetical protein